MFGANVSGITVRVAEALFTDPPGVEMTVTRDGSQILTDRL